MKNLLCLITLVLAVAVVGTADGGVVLDGGGLVLAEQGGTFAAGNLASGATAFALDEHVAAVHTIAHLNDGIYGNPNSWIGGGDVGTSGPFVGISLGAATTAVQSIAFGRDNGESNPSGGAYVDRWGPGVYTLQYTQVASPDGTTADADWTDIGTLDYQGAGGAGFDKPWLRHRYNFDAVDATGIRLMVADTAVCIDEVELYAAAGDIVIQPPPPPLALTPEPGFSMSFDGNEGRFFDPAAPPEQVGAPQNLALTATAFGTSEYGAGGVHLISNVNDGNYGNSNSWLGVLDGSDPEPFIGLDFAGTDPVAIESIAFGRDNGNSNPPGTDPGPGGVLMDRWAGVYTLQYTLSENPDALTEDTGDAATGWATVGTIDLVRIGEPGEIFEEAWLRHEFDLALDGGPIMATGVRILAPMGNAIDELEVNPIPEPSTLALLGVLGVCLMLVRRRRERA